MKICRSYLMILEIMVKIALNIGFSRDIQWELIQSLKIDDCVDGYISSKDVPK